jgi:hypothetical protein
VFCTKKQKRAFGAKIALEMPWAEKRTYLFPLSWVLGSCRRGFDPKIPCIALPGDLSFF